jgi:hypothetical protein
MQITQEQAAVIPGIIYSAAGLCMPSMIGERGPEVARERIARDGVGWWDISGIKGIVSAGGLDFTITVPAELYEHSYRISRPRGPKSTQMVSSLETVVNASGEETKVSMVIGTLTKGQFQAVGRAQDVDGDEQVNLVKSWLDALNEGRHPPGTVARRV